MVVVMTAEAGETEVDGVVDRVRAAGGDAFVSRACPGRLSAWSVTSITSTR